MGVYSSYCGELGCRRGGGGSSWPSVALKGTDAKASYEFRDLHGRPITKREAKVIADRLNHARKENKKKASSARKTQKPSTTKPDSPIPESLGNILLKLAAGLGVDPHRLETQIGNLLPNQKQIKGNNEKSKNTPAIT